MKKIVAASIAAFALALPAAAAAGDGNVNGNGWGAQWQAATGCTYGQIVNLVNADPNHPSVDGLGAKKALEAVLPLIQAGQHPLPTC